MASPLRPTSVEHEPRQASPGWLACSLVLMLVSGSCMVRSVPEDLQQGVDAMAYMVEPFQLRRSMFVALFPNGTASQYVSYLFSPIGASEWPARENAADPGMQLAADQDGRPTLPAGVAFTDRMPKRRLGRQIVVRANAAAGTIVIDAYRSAIEPPILSVERKLRIPPISPDERRTLEARAQGHLELGRSAQAF